MSRMYAQLGHHPFHPLIRTHALNFMIPSLHIQWIYYHYHTSFTGCDCNAGGSKSNVCSKESGKCPCQENIVGQKCGR